MANRAITGGRRQNKHKVKGNIMKQLLALILRRDPDRRLRSSTNRHHLVTYNFKPGDKFDDESSDNFDDEYRLKQEQFGNCDRLYARSGDHDRPGHGQAGALRYW